MFQLIVAVISIALVAALAIASLYYGGQAFQKSSLKANVTTLVNGGQQVAGAQALYRTEHSGLSTTAINDLVTGEYLSALPSVPGIATGDWSIDASGDLAVVTVGGTDADKVAVCNEAAAQAGEADYAADVAALTALTDQTAPAGQFGCMKTGSAYAFAFKI